MGNRKSIMVYRTRSELTMESNSAMEEGNERNSNAPTRTRKRKRKRKSTAILPNIPDEILTEVFVRLPIVSLLRLRCVCKSWYSLISNPNFIAAHIVHQKTAKKDCSLVFKFLHRFSEGEFYLLRFDNDDLEVREDIELELRDKPKRAQVYGTCNGVICLSSDQLRYDSDIFLWNPAIRKVKVLPESLIHFRAFHSYSVHVAFGFLPSVNDYKVVRIVYFSRRVNGHDVISSEVEVYNVSTDCWRKVFVNSAPLCYMYDTVQFVNVTAYWLACRKREVGSVDFIVAFDMLNEVFEEIMLPGCVCKREECVSMAAFGGSLYFSHCNGVAHNNHDCDIWVLKFSRKKFSWTKQYTINLPDIRGPPLGFRKNGEVILVRRNGREVSYNLEVKQAEDFELGQFPKSSRVDSFVESLVLLSGGNGVLGLKISRDAEKADGAGGKSDAKKADGAGGKSDTKKADGADVKRDAKKADGADGKCDAKKADGADGKRDAKRADGADGKHQAKRLKKARISQ